MKVNYVNGLSCGGPWANGSYMGSILGDCNGVAAGNSFYPMVTFMNSKYAVTLGGLSSNGTNSNRADYGFYGYTRNATSYTWHIDIDPATGAIKAPKFQGTLEGSVAYGNVTGRPTFSLSGTTLTITC